MVEIGDEVVIMSAPGRFKVIAMEGPLVTIENADGIRKTVLDQSVRTVPKANAD